MVWIHNFKTRLTNKSLFKRDWNCKEIQITYRLRYFFYFTFKIQCEMFYYLDQQMHNILTIKYV